MRADLSRLRRAADGTKQGRRKSGEARLWHIGASLAFGFTAAVFGLAALSWLAWVLLRRPKIPHPGILSLHDTVSVIQLVFASVAGAGALVALIVSYRRQKVAEADSAHDRTRVFNERFTAIAAQLGDDKPAVRLAGVHAMAGLADDWEANRQTCIDVLCAYLRLPYEPYPGDEAPALERLSYRASREVRHTVIRVITAHLRKDAVIPWRDYKFDFTGTVFDGGDFSNADFTGSTFFFNDAEFSNGTVLFTGTKFSGGVVSFVGCKFSGGEVRFNHVELSGATVLFTYAEFSAGTVLFEAMKLSDYIILFDGAKFSGGEVRFTLSEFSGAPVVFVNSEFSGATVRFTGAIFSTGPVSFNWAKFSGSQVYFDGAQFSGSPISFTNAEFSGGMLDFSNAADWSHPPEFDQPVSPTVKLPQSKDTRSQVETV